MQNYHLVDDDGTWKLKKQGAERSSEVYNDETKVDSVQQAADYIREHGGGSLKIHNKDGTIQEERTYPRSADPRESEG